MECEWKYFPPILASRLVVYLHVVINSLLIAKMEVVFHVPICNNMMRSWRSIIFFLNYNICYLNLIIFASTAWYAWVSILLLLYLMNNLLSILWQSRSSFSPGWRSQKCFSARVAVSVSDCHLGRHETVTCILLPIVWSSLWLLHFLVSLYLGKDLIGFPLSPQKVVLMPLFEVTCWPPEPRLKSTPY